MKPPKPTRKVAELRVTRKTIMDLKHSEGHGWAVSYADLLMVLLSFFVLFFSLDDNPKGAMAQLRMISMQINGKETLSSNGGKGLPGGPFEEGDTDEEVSEETKRQIASLADSLKVEGLKLVPKGDRLIVALEDSSFDSGEFRTNAKLKEQIASFSQKIMPYKDKVSVTIIGHTDDRPMAYRNEFLTDNFDLSSMRALTVLKIILKDGFPKEQASARAAGSFERNSRSITFEVQLKKSFKGDRS